MSRHFERRISLAVTRRLAAGSMTPNTMTIDERGDRSRGRAAISLAGAPRGS